MIDVLLINTKRGTVFSASPPLTISQVAACLEKSGFETRVIDLCVENLGREQLIKKIESINPSVIGIIENVPSINETVKIGKLIKENFDIPLVVGGLQVTLDPNFLLRFRNIFDYALVGEWEITFPLFVKKILNGKKPGKRIIKGRSVENLDKLPLPAYHLLPMKKYTLEYFTVVSSKGCPFNCIFCPFITSKVRFKSEKKVEEITWLKERYKVRKFSFHDENLPIAKSHTLKISQEIRREGMDIEWKCQGRCDLFNRYIVEALKKAGCEAIGMGVETGSEELRRKLNKPLTNRVILDAVENARKAGLKVITFMMIGFPFETEEDLKESVNFLKKIKPDGVWVQLAVPFPGTKFFDIAIKYGMDKEGWFKFASGENTFYPFALSKLISKLKYMHYLTQLYLCAKSSLTNLPVFMNFLSTCIKLFGQGKKVPYFDKLRKMGDIVIKRSPDKLTF